MLLLLTMMTMLILLLTMVLPQLLFMARYHAHAPAQRRPQQQSRRVLSRLLDGQLLRCNRVLRVLCRSEM
jgi:hypothetical protein